MATALDRFITCAGNVEIATGQVVT
jgi:hypothetical protein